MGMLLRLGVKGSLQRSLSGIWLLLGRPTDLSSWADSEGGRWSETGGEDVEDWGNMLNYEQGVGCQSLSASAIVISQAQIALTSRSWSLISVSLFIIKLISLYNQQYPQLFLPFHASLPTVETR